MNVIRPLASALVLAALATGSAAAQQYKTDVPASIGIADKVETRLGTLRFRDGVPDEATARTIYDNLDFQRAVQAYLTTLPAASLVSMREGLKAIGVDNTSVALFSGLMDSRSLFLTGNTETVYLTGWLDLRDGPMVIESTPNILGFVDDAWFHYVTDIGNAGPDRGKGGKFLILPPDYKGEVPDGYFVSRSKTYGVWLGVRGFLVKGDPRPAADGLKAGFRIYPLAQAANPPPTRFIEASGKAFNTIPPTDASLFEQVNRVVQEEPADAMDAETLGGLAAIGIEKGRPFAPDTRMKAILVEAAAVGAATTRTLRYRSRTTDARIYPDSAWRMSFAGGSHEWLKGGARLVDPRASFFFAGTGITPAMTLARVGVGSAYAGAFTDADGRHFDGGKTYRLHLPAGIPAKDFWSLVVYDTQTRSQLQTDQQFPSVGSLKPDLAVNPDGSVDVYFGPKEPAGHASNWVQTLPGKGWFVSLRLYAPLQPWFDRTWKPGEFEQLK
jgi:hypothetical protein